MSKRAWLLLLAVVLILVLAGVALALLAGGQGQARTAVIRFVEGLVNVRLGEAEDFIAALVDMLLSSGDELSTGEDGHSILELDNGMIVVIAPNSSFEVVEMAGGVESPLTRLFLNAGEIFSISASELPEGGAYEVITPAGVVGIRGSAMGARYDPIAARVEATCLSGRCQVSTEARSVDLAGNQWIGLSVEQGILDQPAPLTDEQLQRWGQAIDKVKETGLDTAFEAQCACQDTDLVCKDGVRIERFPACHFFHAETLRELRYYGSDSRLGASPDVYTLYSGFALGYELSQVSGMDIQRPDGTRRFVPAWQGFDELVLGYSEPGEPQDGAQYRFRLLDAAGQPIEGMTDEDTWRTCSLEAPEDIHAVITPEQDIELSWQRVSGAQNYGVVVENYPKGGKRYEAHPAGSKSRHVIPWPETGVAASLDDATGQSLSQLPDGDYSVMMFAYKRGCLAVNLYDRLLFTKLGEQLDYFESARSLIPYGQTPAASTQIVIDGRPDDWAARQALSADPAGDAEQGFIDLAESYAFVNQQALYVMIETVDPNAPLAQFDIEIWTPERQYLLTWQPGEGGAWIADITTEWQDIGPAERSSFWMDEVIEMRIDLRDLEQPEKVDLSEVRAMVGKCCGEEWRAADQWKPAIVPALNETDSPAPTIPYGQTPEAETKILIDGNASDWSGQAAVSEDMVGDAESGFLDLASGYAFINQQALYFLLETVDPEAGFVQFDIELQADDRLLMLSWQPGSATAYLADISGGGWQGIGDASRSRFAFGPALEARIDLRDLDLPQVLKIKIVRVMVGECCGEAWRSADSWQTALTPIVNEVDQ
ncbi:MAG: FecR domain-containing protein [Anaerolineales bacterium]|nr:FecR domain-containing protein [Anaerolineales bacterium]